MKIGLAFPAGVIGGAVMTVLLFFARLIGMTEMNLAMVMGAMVTREVSAGTWLLGFVLHLAISGIIGILYGVFFELFKLATWWLGILFGIVHAILGGVYLVFLPRIHPAIPDLFAPPGFLALNYGLMTAVGFVGLHMVYGAILGAIYTTGHTLIKPVRERNEPHPQA